MSPATDTRDAPPPGRPFAIALIGLACSAVAVAIALAAGLLDRGRPLTFGHDLLSSYAAGRLVADGRGAELYSAAACEGVGRRVIADANLTGDPRHVRFLNPGFFALAFAPLAALPYRTALLVWVAVNAALAGATLRVLGRWVPGRRRRLVLLAAVATSCPLLLALQHQQNTFLSLALLTAAVAAWRADKPLVAGLLVALLGYKPQVAAVLGIALALSAGPRALAGLLIGGVGLLLAGEWASPGSAVAFLAEAPKAVAVFHGSPGFNWGRQVTPTGFARPLLGPGTWAAAVGYAVSAATIVGVAVAAWHRGRVYSRASGRDDDACRAGVTSAAAATAAVAVVALPLAAPYYMDYDLLLLAVPAALALSADRPGRAVVALWVLLWPAAYANADAVAATGVGPVVPLLGGLLVATWATARLGRRGRSDTIAGGEVPAGTPQRLAA